MRRLKAIVAVCAALLAGTGAYAQQNSDAGYPKPLKEVLAEIQDRYKVKIKTDEKLMADKTVTYAEWKFRPDVDQTLENVLSPLNLKVIKDSPGNYKLSEFQYWNWPVEDGWKQLDKIASQYNDKASFEARKALLRPQIYAALGLSPMPAKMNTKPIITPKRVYDGYSVENIALEILPGVYINGSLYRPLNVKGKIPLMLSPDGHWYQHRFRADCQIRCATLARMGVMAYSYDVFAWGESGLQFKSSDHRKALAETIQALGAIRILDYMLSLKETDPERVGISGGSGGGSHTVLMTALDTRIKLSAPVVAVSSYFYGGCPCESGMPVAQCGGGTDNVELAAMSAPQPQLLISDGSDWTAHMPEHDFPYLKKVYGYYGAADKVENVHLPNDKHDYGPSKRFPLYDFVARNFHVDINKIKKDGKIDESHTTIEKEPQLYVFGDHGQNLPKDAIHGFDQLEKVFAAATGK
ncbi:acetyl xylan esterase AXE1 [Mucilaginibacter yixingensis]|uniref:Acetyl xylan esterase AXE1 n=1 Tax=Mucilaginibacter yixingensis TaxID=1295612 RepID=A0A2T5J8F0_9SPHI|nr:acetylxylan esterase [Mucilaginibacter yixingensis]PTQ95737.1 acetyl xylan esterase AXE1 [Mucilaginibacter yixingensis]